MVTGNLQNFDTILQWLSVKKTFFTSPVMVIGSQNKILLFDNDHW